MSIKINRITLGIANIERTIQFYNTWLGIKPYEQPFQGSTSGNTLEVI